MIRFISESIKQILKTEGKSILLNPSKFEILLKSALKELKREAFVVSKLLEINVPQSISLSSHRLDLEFYKSQFQIVFSSFRFSEDAIVTGLASWTDALGYSYNPEFTAKALVSAYPNSSLPSCGNKVVHGLAELLFKYGQTTCFAKNWLELRLKKAFPLYRGEVFLITSLLNLKVPQEMLELSKHDSLDTYMLKIENRILQEIPFEINSLSWAIDAWKFALGIEVQENSSIFEKSIIKANPTSFRRSNGMKQNYGQSLYPSNTHLAINTNVSYIIEKNFSQPISNNSNDFNSSSNPKANSNVNLINQFTIRPFFVYLLIFCCLILLIKQLFSLYDNYLERDYKELKTKEVAKKLSPFYFEEGENNSLQNNYKHINAEIFDEKLNISQKRLSSMTDDQIFELALKLFMVPSNIYKQKARILFSKLAKKNYPSAKAFLAFMLIVGDGGDDDLETAEKLVDELVRNNDLYQLKIFYELLCFSAIAGNPISQKIVDDFKKGQGYFNTSILPEKNFLKNILWK